MKSETSLGLVLFYLVLKNLPLNVDIYLIPVLELCCLRFKDIKAVIITKRSMAA